MNGALVVDKPSGCTSHDVVVRVRRATGIRRIGHTGTLDPLATGVLVLLLGPATRLARFLAAGHKVYEARIRLGVATETYDATGRPVPIDATRPAAPAPTDRQAVDRALASFLGTHLQAPPPFSAKRMGGVRAYELARRRVPVRPPPVAVTLHDVQMRAFEGDGLDVRLTCSPGYYVRALAHDLGERLGCGAHLEALRRVRAGEFSIDQAVPLGALEAEGPACRGYLVPLARLLVEFPEVVLTAAAARRAAHGNPVRPSGLPGWHVDGAGSDEPADLATGHYRLFDEAGVFIGVAELRDDESLHPVVVLV